MNTRILLMVICVIAAGFGMSCKKSEKTAPATAKPAAPTAVAPEVPQPTAAAAETKSSQQAQAPAKAPDFSLMDQDGKEVKRSDFTGKIIVLEWMNTECPYVKSRYASQAIPHLAKTYMEKGVVWLAINSTKDSNIQKNKAWRSEHQLTYPVLDDHAGSVGKQYRAKTTPHIFIIDTAGNLAYQGAYDSDSSSDARNASAATNYVKDVLDDLLAGNSPRHSKTQSYGCSVKYAP